MAPARSLAAAAAALVITTVPLGVAEPECLALGEFQIQPIVFQCGGSDWSSSGDQGNEFMELLQPRTAKNIVDVPAGTKDFIITMQPKKAHQGIAGQIHVQNIETGDFIVKKKLKPHGLNEGNQDALFVYNWTYDGGHVNVEYWEHNTVMPRSQQVKFFGTLPVKIRIQATNAMADATLFRFMRYSYGAFDASKPSGHMCLPDTHSENCHHYYQYYTRLETLGWCNKAKAKWPDVNEGWKAVWDSDLCPPDLLPSYMWERTWGKVEKLTWNSRRAWQAYKFLSYGGFETNSPGVTRLQWDFCYKLDKVNAFAEACCKLLKGKYTSESDPAFKTPVGKGMGGTVWAACMGLPEAVGVTQDDYAAYLDADGYQGVLRSDLRYCWVTPTTPIPQSTTTIRSLPTAAPRSTTQPSTMAPNKPGCARLIATASPGDTKLQVNEVAGTGWHGTRGGRLGTFIHLGSQTVGISSIGATVVQLEHKVSAAHASGTEVCKAAHTGATTPSPGSGTHPSGSTPHPSGSTPHPGSSTTMVVKPLAKPNGTGVSCSFNPAPLCQSRFTYKGVTVIGCTTTDHKGGAWCSEDASFVLGGRWHRCTWDCVSPHSCYWKPQQACVKSFETDGHVFNGCTKYKYNTAWCSTVDKFVQGKNNWRHCEWDCQCYWKPSWECKDEFTYKGVAYRGCSTTDQLGTQAWCSKNSTFSGPWAACTHFCPRDPADRTQIPKASTISATKCYWKAPPACEAYWQYEAYGYQVQGCSGQNHVGQWCSNKKVYKPGGAWSHCNWACDSPVRCHYQMAQGCVNNFQYKGTLYSGCTRQDSIHDKPWCSLTSEQSEHGGNWAYCKWDCPCFWQRHPECVESFFPYAGAQESVNGCLVSGGSGWCSTTAQFSGHYRWCSWACVKDHHMSGAGYPYALVGAGAGVATAVTAGGIWAAVEAANRRRTTTTAPEQWAPWARKYTEHGVSVATGPMTTSPLLIMTVVATMCSFCILLAIGMRISAKRRGTYRRLDEEDREDALLTE